MAKQSKSETKEVKSDVKDVKSAVDAAVEAVQKSAKKRPTEDKKEEKKEEKKVAEKPAKTEKTEKTEKNTKKEDKKVAEPAPAPVAEAVVAVAEESEERAARRQVTRESVEASFDSLLKQLDEEIDGLRKNEDKNKSKGVRFLRPGAKQVRQLRSDALRVASKKTRRATTSSTAGNSGFMKPVNVSKEMRAFANLKEDQLVSRVDVTKAICKYVKEKNLQVETDRRQFTPDAQLAKLLNTDKPITYYALQQHIQSHFVKDK